MLISNSDDEEQVHQILAVMISQKEQGSVVSGVELLQNDKLSQTIKKRSLNFVDTEHLKHIHNHTIKGQVYACYQKN